MRPALGVVRGVLALAGVVVLFTVMGLWQRCVVWPLVSLWPSRRPQLVGGFMRFMAKRVVQLMQLGGARIERRGSIPSDQPVLVVMNHQSLLDIPVVASMASPSAVRFVTRARYARGAPLVSLLLRLSEAPIVDPVAQPREAVSLLARTAETLESALLIFPEGARSVDGSLGKFRKAGLRAILARRALPVYLVATDGFWRCRTLGDFALHVDRIRGRTEVMGPFQPREPLGAFVDELHGRLAARLQQLREEAAGG